MARVSFICYANWYEKIALLTDEQTGVLFKAIFSYVSDNQLPEMDAMTKMCFSFLKETLDMDAKKYDEILKIRSEVGKKGADARWNGKNGKGIFANENDNGKNGKGIFANAEAMAKMPITDNCKLITDISPNKGLLAHNAPARTREHDEEYEHEGWNPDELITTTDGTQIRLGDVHFGKTVKLRRKQSDG